MCGINVAVVRKLLVEVWVILDRPPNDPFLRKKEPFTSSFPSGAEAGIVVEAGNSRFIKLTRI
jgi:hypothetical protein